MLNNTIISLLDRSETHDSSGKPIQWVPYEIHSPTKRPQLYAKHVVPVNQDRYEVGFGVVPLPTTSTTTTATTSTTTIPTFTPDILDVDELPAHLVPFFAPKVIRVQNTVRLVQYRFDEQQKDFCWQTMSQPLREPSTTIAKPAFRISCPNLDKKFDFESVFWFLRHYNIRKDGTYYKATPETVCDARGYGKYGSLAPDADRKLFYLLLYNTL